MKPTLISALVTLLVIAIAPRAGAQATPPLMGQGGPPPAAPPPPPGQPYDQTQVIAPPPGAPAPPIQTGTANPSVSGVLKQYLLTPVGDVEGVELQDGTDVRFPPHMGAALTAIVKPGDRINVVGFVTPQTAYGRAIKALTISNAATNQTVVDQPPTAPPPPPWMNGANMRTMNVSGTLDHYVLNDRGDIDGLILNNGNEVKFPPHIGAAVAMASMQQPAATVQASGYGTTNAFGTVVDAMTGSLTIGSQSIPLIGPPGPPPPP